MTTENNIQPVLQRFKLLYTTKKLVNEGTPKFGFNGLGEVVFRRTYSRDNESWNDVVKRVIEGVMSIRKEHFVRNSLEWNDSHWQEFAKEMAMSLFNMEWMPPGRGLWMMGTDFMYARGSTSLNNCSAVDTKDDLVHAAEWTMDCLMNGVGVGFSTNWRGEATKPNKEDTITFTIPDSREGWLESLTKLLCSYINSKKYGKNKYPTMDYSQIRPSGSPIKGFGGVSSGPEPLKKLHQRIESYLDAFCDQKLEAQVKTWKEITDEVTEKSEWKEVEMDICKPYDHTRLIADIFNSIGACVVAGNVRRCLPGDALVHTENGLIPIKDVKVGQKVMTMDGYHKISNIFNQGEQQLIRIKTQDGDFRCTPNHKMAVCSGYNTYTWKEASTLTQGDRLISPRYQISGQITSLPFWTYDKPDKSTNCKDIVIPQLDCDMAWLIGVFHGNGYVYANHEKNGFNAYISVVGGLTEYDTMVDVQKQIQRFGKDLLVTFEKRNNENSYIVRCQSKQLALYFDKYIKQSKTIIKIPDYILQGCNDIKLAYVSGITDADGCLTNRPVNVVSTKYENFARELQILLYSCGIESRLNICTVDYPSRKDNWSKIHQVNLITKYSQHMFDAIPQLHKNMNKTSRVQNANGFPTEYETDTKTKSKFGLYSNKQFNLDAYDRHYGNSDIVPIEFIGVENDISEQTYDIEVENRHEFICNGYLTHNSAEIALGNVNDQTFINLKNYVENPERGEIGWMSNNSVVLNSDHNYEDFSYIPDMARRIIDNGEPGMINLYNIQKFGRYGKEMEDKANLVNPCLTADTWILTSLGSFQVKNLLGKQFSAVVDGKVHNCNTGFFPTGTKPVYQLTTYEGFTVKTTGDHKFMTSTGEWVELEKFVEGDTIKIHDHSSLSVQVDNLSIDFMDGWLMGNLYGDGTFQYNADKPSTAYLCYWGNNKAMMADVAISRLDALSYKRKSEFITGTEYNDKITIANNHLYQRATTYIQRGKVLTDHVESASLNFQAGFLRGWFDADGSVQGTKEKGYSIRLACSNLNSLYRAQRMTLRLGIYGKIYQNRMEEHDKMLQDGHGCYKSYHCQAQHEFIISRDGLKTFQDKINFDDPEKQSKLQEILSQYKCPVYGVKFNATVKSITLIGEESVYDATVENVHALDANGFYVHNCGEIPLESFELCNLAEVFPPRCKNGERYFQALKFATFYASTVSLLPTHRSETNAVIAKNRRIGVSISGVAQWASGEVDSEWGDMNYTKMTKFLREGYKVVRDENKKLAQQAGVPESIRVTTVKPSGSISLLAGVTAGVHYPVSRYAIRRMRIGADSPLVKVLQDAGVPNEPDSYSDNTLVFSFAIDHGNVRPCEEVSPWEQFSLVATMQRCYADNCVSATIYFDKEKDAADVEKMLAMYIPILKSVSMLPHAGHGYKQAPYEPITQEQYEKLKDEYKLPDFSTLSGMVPIGSKFCSGDTCEA